MARSFATCHPDRLVQAHGQCKQCYQRAWGQRRTSAQLRDKRLWDNFKLTSEDFDARMEAQGGVCAVCGSPPPPGSYLHVDHDHGCCPTKRTCGQCVRGLLCQGCNHGIGKFGDDPARLRAAADYLGSV